MGGLLSNMHRRPPPLKKLSSMVHQFDSVRFFHTMVHLCIPFHCRCAPTIKRNCACKIGLGRNSAGLARLAATGVHEEWIAGKYDRKTNWCNWKAGITL